MASAISRRLAPTALAALLLLPLLPAASGAVVLAAYPVDWSLVPSSPSANVSVQAGCICKLLNATCTPHCCCDPDCPAPVVAAYESAGACLPEGPAADQLDMCTPEERFAQVNLPSGNYYRIQKAAAGNGFLPQLLCVVSDHNPSLGATYPDPQAGDVASNAQQAACPAAASAVEPPAASYMVGSPLVAIYPASSGGSALRANFSIPAAALSAECLDGVPLGFMARMPAGLREQTAACQRTVPAAAFATACASSTSPLSPLYYTGTTFPANPASTGTPLAPVVASITRIDPATGTATVLPSTPAAPVLNAVPAPAKCTGVVVAAAYTFTYDMDPSSGAAQLAGVSIELTLGDMRLPASGGAAVLRQAFSTRWLAAGAAAQQALPFSGALGYLQGFPVLAGVAVEQAPIKGKVALQAVARWQEGLTLPAPTPASGQCSPAAAAAPVGFGYNASSSCSQAMDLGQLAAFCAAGGGNATAALAAALGSAYLEQLAGGAVRVGVWGNSDWANAGEWVPLVVSNYPPAAPMAWDAATATCANLVTGFDITLLTGLAYSTSNLQSKVLYARICFRYGSWQYDGAQDAATAQRFALTFTAGFTAAQQADPTPARKPPPPLFKPLHPDLFFPFLSGNGAAGSRPSGAGVTWGAASAALGLLWLLL